MFIDEILRRREQHMLVSRYFRFESDFLKLQTFQLRMVGRIFMSAAYDHDGSVFCWILVLTLILSNKRYWIYYTLE